MKLNTIKSLVSMTGLLTLSVLTGCAHVHEVDGRQEKSEIPPGFRVRIGNKEVREGDTVIVYKNECKKAVSARGRQMEQCDRLVAGKATVLKVLDHDSAIIDPKGGLAIENSMTVEKE